MGITALDHTTERHLEGIQSAAYDTIVKPQEGIAKEVLHFSWNSPGRRCSINPRHADLQFVLNDQAHFNFTDLQFTHPALQADPVKPPVPPLKNTTNDNFQSHIDDVRTSV